MMMVKQNKQQKKKLYGPDQTRLIN